MPRAALRFLMKSETQEWHFFVTTDNYVMPQNLLFRVVKSMRPFYTVILIEAVLLFSGSMPVLIGVKTLSAYATGSLSIIPIYQLVSLNF